MNKRKPPESVQSILQRVDQYYSEKLTAHGATPRGVDWNSTESQTVRFAQLIRVWEGKTPSSVLDFGCGYGALAGFLRAKGIECAYTGYDVSRAMIAKAEELHASQGNVSFFHEEALLTSVKYTVASGVFNVKLHTPIDDWQDYIRIVLEKMWGLSQSGMAFNMLTSYSDPEKMRPDLYYADPSDIFHYCKTRFSAHVAVLHDYGLYEFTVLVRREARATPLGGMAQ